MTVDREKLYQEVWAEPMTKVAVRYKVSSSFLARVCKRLNVPKPPRGYWAKQVVGKAPARPALPDLRPGDELDWAKGNQPNRLPLALPKPPEKKRRRKMLPETEQPARHGLLVGVEEYFQNSRDTKSGYLRPFKKLLVDIFVSKDSFTRAIDTANKLFLDLERFGYHVVFAPRDRPYSRPNVDERMCTEKERFFSYTWTPARPTIVMVGTVAIGLTLFELSEELEYKYVNGKKVLVSEIPFLKSRRALSISDWVHTEVKASGKFCLRASSPYHRAAWEKQWRESEPGELLGKIPRIIKELESAAVTIANLVEEGERQAAIERQKWEVEHQKWLVEQAERRRIQNIKDSREQLFSVIEAWGVVKRIEEFFEDIERRSHGLENEDRQRLLDRVTRARELMGSIDALKHFRAWKTPEER